MKKLVFDDAVSLINIDQNLKILYKGEEYYLPNGLTIPETKGKLNDVLEEIKYLEVTNIMADVEDVFNAVIVLEVDYNGR